LFCGVSQVAEDEAELRSGGPPEEDTAKTSEGSVDDEEVDGGFGNIESPVDDVDEDKNGCYSHQNGG